MRVERRQECLRALDVRYVSGSVDHAQGPAEPGARRLAQAHWHEAVVAAPEQLRGDRYAPQYGVVDLLRATADELTHRALDVRQAGASAGVVAEGPEPSGIAGASPVEIEERQALEALRVLFGGAYRESDRRDPQVPWHPVRAYPGRAVDQQPFQLVAVLGGEAGGETPEQRVGDERWPLRRGQAHQLHQPACECRMIQTGERL